MIKVTLPKEISWLSRRVKLKGKYALYVIIHVYTEKYWRRKELYLMMTEQGKRVIMISRFVFFFAISYKTKKNSFGKVCIRLFFWHNTSS